MACPPRPACSQARLASSFEARIPCAERVASAPRSGARSALAVARLEGQAGPVPARARVAISEHGAVTRDETRIAADLDQDGLDGRQDLGAGLTPRLDRGECLSGQLTHGDGAEVLEIATIDDLSAIRAIGGTERACRADIGEACTVVSGGAGAQIPADQRVQIE